MRRATALIAGSGILMTFAGAWFGVVSPLMSWKTQKVSDYQQVTQEITDLEYRQANLKSDLRLLDTNENTDFIWIAQRSGEATAQVQAYLSAAATQNGIDLRSITPNTSQTLSGTSTVGFRLEAEAPLDHLTRFLRQVEFNMPSLLVDRGTLRRLNRPGAMDEQPVVFMQLDVTAPIALSGEVAE